MMIAVLAAGGSPAVAWAADAAEIQEMKREVAKLRGQVQALQSAVVEATDMERQRAANLTKVMKELSVAPGPAAPMPAAPPPAAPAPAGEATETRAPAVPAATTDEKPRKPSKQRRHRRSGRARWKAASRAADR